MGALRERFWERPLADLTSEEWEARWALMDSGSSINGINAEKDLPSFPVEPSPAQINGEAYACANGGMLANKGQVVTQTLTAEKHARQITWQNVAIEMPILSTSSYNDDNYDVQYHARGKGGTIINNDNGERIQFIRHGRVFF